MRFELAQVNVGRLAAPIDSEWWIPAGTIPTVREAEERLTLLRALGPSPEAFTFRRFFPPPDEAPVPTTDDRDLCPAP